MINRELCQRDDSESELVEVEGGVLIERKSVTGQSASFVLVDD